MPVDYSKWDNLELSDDSDIEVHPNVDKRSFIRAKQNQIHLERQQRRHQIATLQYERQVNDGLAKRIDGLLGALRGAAGTGAAAAETAFKHIMEAQAQAGAEADRPPAPPADVHARVENPSSYTQMMAALLDQVAKAVGEKRDAAGEPLAGDALYEATVEEVAGHQRKVADLQAQLATKLAELEREEARKITSDSIHTGFDSSHVNKASDSSGSGSGKVELLNPNYGKQAGGGAGTGKTAAEDKDDTDGDATEPTALARQFAAIAADDHYASKAFMAAHPQVLSSERHEEGVLMLAFDAEMEGNADAARRCVHQAKLLEYCRSLGRDGVPLFFKRIETRDHKAHDLFYGDVRETYGKIHTRVREIKAQQAASGADAAAAGGVEQIQLHAVEPGTAIHIRVPPPVDSSSSSSGEVDADAVKARQIFEGFAPDMRQALESGSLDKVNEVLGRMPVAEAEALVGEFGEAGILSLEDEIIDATTEEGRAHLKELGREEMVDEEGVAHDGPAAKEEYGDPE